MKLILQNTVLSVLGAAAIIAAFFLFANPFKAAADATTLPATVATSSPSAVTTTARTIFATSTCATRVISTRESAITLTFSDNQGVTPTATYGHVQAASTTVAYDAAQYGCNAFKAYSFTAQNLSVMEAR